VPTQTKQGGSVKGALILIAIFGIAALIVSVKGTPHKVQLPPDSDLRETITLSVTFIPSTRIGQGVEIQGHVENVLVTPPRLFINHSPWNQLVTIPKGAAVTLYALQVHKGDLDCVITRNGVTESHSHRPDQGSVRCYLNRPAN
jgi:hypothetical protein